MNKQGELPSGLIALLIIMVTIVVTLFFVNKAKDAIDEAAAANCAAAVREAHFSNKIYGWSRAQQIGGCATENIIIDASNLPQDDEQKQAAVNKLLADEMLRCWQEWGSGKLDLFGGTGTYCYVCSRISFTDFPEGYQVRGLNQYMHEKKPYGPTKPTYEELLQGYSKGYEGIDTSTLGSMPQVFLPARQEAVVVFWYSKDQQKLVFAEWLARRVGWELDIAPETQAGGVVLGAGAIMTIAGGGWITKALRAVSAGPVTGLTSLGGLTYAYNRARDEWQIMSATYLITSSEVGFYAGLCEEAAAPPISP